MYWRSNSATGSPFFTMPPGLAASWSTRLNSLPPPMPPPPPPPRDEPPPPLLAEPIPPGPLPPPLREFDVEPRPSAPITELPLEAPGVEARGVLELELLLELTRLVAACIADELREVDWAPLELETVSDPSAATELPPPEDAPPP